MKKEFLEHSLKELQKTFSKIFLKSALEKISPLLLKEPDRAMELAFDYFILNSAFLPSPAQLLERVQMEGRNLRMEQGKRIEDEQRQRKREEIEQGSILTRKFGSQMGRDWQALMAVILAEPKTPWPKIIDNCWEFNAKYPGLNFDQLAHDWSKEHLHA
jgi:hypothetical protein